MNRFVCHCGFLGQNGVRAPKAKKTLKPSIRYRPDVLNLVVCGELANRFTSWLALGLFL